MATTKYSTAGLRALRFAAILGFSAAHMAASTSVVAQESSRAAEPVPHTFGGAGDAFKQGGKEIGAAFRGIGRGVKDTFTGRRSADDYKHAKQIGSGAKDIGRGIAGGARATGREIKNGVTGRGDGRN